MSRMRTKLILTQEVIGLGTPGDVVDVAPGYARNYLIPRGYATPWTRGGQKQVEQIKRARAVREIRTLEEAQEAAGLLEKLTVRLRRKAGANGRLFGSVGPADIAAAVKESGGPDVDKRKIVVTDPIKTTGSHRVQVRLHAEVNAGVKVDVQAT